MGQADAGLFGWKWTQEAGFELTPGDSSSKKSQSWRRRQYSGRTSVRRDGCASRDDRSWDCWRLF
jgi:hypothetical protein